MENVHFKVKGQGGVAIGSGPYSRRFEPKQNYEEPEKIWKEFLEPTALFEIVPVKPPAQTPQQNSSATTKPAAGTDQQKSESKEK